MNPRRTAAALTVCLAVTVGAACGDDSKDASKDDSTTEGTAGSVTTGASGPADGADDAAIPGLEEGLASVGLEAKASAVEIAMGEDEIDMIEVDGSTMHVHLKGGTFDPSMACMVVGGVLSDGESAVMHLDGEEIACD